MRSLGVGKGWTIINLKRFTIVSVTTITMMVIKFVILLIGYSLIDSIRQHNHSNPNYHYH